MTTAEEDAGWQTGEVETSDCSEIRAKVIPVLRNGRDGPGYPVLNRCLFGSSRNCNIIIQNLKKKECLLEVSSERQAVLKTGKEIERLYDKSRFTVGHRVFWLQLVRPRKEDVTSKQKKQPSQVNSDYEEEENESEECMSSYSDDSDFVPSEEDLED